jgi:hypothetical protein
LTYLERPKRYGPDKLHWEEAEAEEEEEKIRLKQYVSLRSKGIHNYLYTVETGGREATDDIKKECSKNYADAVVMLCKLGFWLKYIPYGHAPTYQI